MSEKTTFDYIDKDLLILVTLINPTSNKKVNAYAYLDTGSDAVVKQEISGCNLGWR
jgi:hypothetical protein